MALNAEFICTTVIFELPSDCQPSEGAKMRQSAFLSQKHRDGLSGSCSVHQCAFAIELVSQASYNFKNNVLKIFKLILKLNIQINIQINIKNIKNILFQRMLGAVKALCSESVMNLFETLKAFCFSHGVSLAINRVI